MNRSDLEPTRLLADFVEIGAGPLRALVRRGYEAEAEALTGQRVPADAEWVGGGRAAHPVVRLCGGERALVRRYRRGGLLRHLNRERYFLGDRARAELLATETARAAGVRVPLVLAAARAAARVGYRAVLATRWIEGAEEAVRALADASPRLRRSLLFETGRQIARMHEAGITHPDLNLRNVLAAGGTPAEPVVYLIDFDRAARHAGPAPRADRAANLRRLARSARKLGDPLGAADWAALREGYGAAWPERLRSASTS
jgi:3-deoxy-D-manno-octulosonic acid kinase